MDWNRALEPLMAQYRGRPHPLAYQNPYQLVVMVVLAAQDSDRHINDLAPALFRAFPTMESLAQATEGELHALLNSVRNFANKSRWLVGLAEGVGSGPIPNTLAELVKLPGIGRKSANVILRESGARAEGVIVDLHVLRVAPRLGLTAETTPEKVERDLMRVLRPDVWADAGMALTFLGRDTCRPSHPHCGVCLMNSVCAGRQR